MNAASAQSRPTSRGTRWVFWGTAYALLVLLTGTNLPTPLYRGYETRFGFSPFVVTLIFAVYIAVLIPSLLLAGPLSDAVGRRRVLLPALGLAALGSAAFALASDVAWLFAGRLLQGVAVGAASGALTAALSELEPGGNRRRAALVSTVVSVGGLGLGPVLGAAVAEYAPAPGVLPFLLEIVLLVPAAVFVARMPETSRGAAPALSRWRPRRPSVPAAVRGVFLTSGSASFAAFAVVGLFLTMVPAYVTSVTGSGNLLLGGAAAALLFAASATVQVLTYGMRPLRLQICGLPVLALGLGLLVLAGSRGSLGVLLVATALAGIGHGLVFLGSLTAVNSLAPPAQHAEVISSFYVVLYAGVGVPVLGLGILATRTGLLEAVGWFAASVAALCLVVLTGLCLAHARYGYRA